MIYLRLVLESFRFAVEALRANVLRTLLSLLGVTIGIFSIISVFTIVDSLERNVRNSMSFIGEGVIYVEKWPWIFDGNYPWWRYFKRPAPSLREFRALEKRLAHQQGVSIFWNKGGATLKNRSNSIFDINVQGVSFGFNKVSDVPVETGRYFTPQEIEGGRNVALIGADIASDLFPGQNPIGHDLKLKGLRFRVVGIMERQGENMFGASNDKNALIPYTAFMRIYPVGPNRLEPSIAVKGLESDIGLLDLEYEIRGVMRSLRSLKPRDEDNFALNRPELLADMVTGLFDVVGIAGWVIGGFSILVGGFGIANIMFVSVKERTNIIGIQKSLGAKNFFILFQFLFEAIFLSLIGGGVGILLVFLITLIPQDALEIMLSIKNIVLGLSVSVVIGLLSGIIPAVLASNLDPVIAIRSK
ncbi:ABC transporter permease [Adhaeribacter terreus]|uniref:ABC transporter permease n=1 Tax=Adhaeribacter terreus TaxID=529703 RepID=A0ABW0EBW7_9BACT